MDFWASTFPDQVINVNYEELVQSPDQVSSKLFEFCHLEWSKEYLNFFQQSVTSFTFSELQVREAINTKKINFSSNYKKQLAIFTDTYNALALANA